MSPLPGLVLALLSLVAWTAAAQPLPERTLRARRVPLTGTPVDVRVAPGIPTTLNFDADINPTSVELGPQSGVQLLSIAPRAITLTPASELGAAVALRVRFAEACSAMEPRFSLRADAAEVDAQVTVYRDARAPELLLAQVAELEARATACERDVAALRERGRSTGPASLVLAGQLGLRGVQVASVVCELGARAGGLTCDKARLFRADTWVVVSIRLSNLPGQPAWKPGRAWLVSESNRESESIPARVVVLEPEALAPESAGTLAVEFALPQQHARRVFRLEVQEAAGTRHLSVADVTVDDAQKPAQKEHGP